MLGELLGDEASDHVIRFYETSVPALCRANWSASPASQSYARGTRAIGAGKIKVLAKQIARFLLAALEMKVHVSDATSGITNRRGCNESSE